MRLVDIEIEGFRAFGGQAHIDLDADVVIVSGANGQGKTSLFDAILWALAGKVTRLGEEPESAVSLFSESGLARVALSVKNATTEARVIRSYDGVEPQLGLEVNGSRFRGSRAESELASLLWPAALASGGTSEAVMAAAIQRGVYLQQDLVIEFIHADTDEERFTAVAELVGAGRVRELQGALEGARNRWARATTVREAEIREVRSRADGLELQIREAPPADANVSVPQSVWDSWWKQTEKLGVDDVAATRVEDSSAATTLDAAVRRLQESELVAEREGSTLRALATELREAAQPDIDIKALDRDVTQATEQFRLAQDALEKAEAAAALVRRQTLELRESQEQLKVFAQLALQHLGEKCPVCEQKYDQAQTQKRLEAIARGDAPEGSEGPPSPDLAAHAAEVERREAKLRQTRRNRDEGASALRAWDERRKELDARLRELDVPDSPVEATTAELVKRERKSQERAKSLGKHRSDGEALALRLARAGQQARRAEIEQELRALKNTIAEGQLSLDARNATYKVTSDMIEALRDAGADIVADELQRLEPLLQRVYATADPHPAFRVVELLSDMKGGKGRIVPRVSDPIDEKESDAPGKVLSSSQMNVLAVSVFLALNLGIRDLPVDSTILDDPLQSLDDLNLLGLIDLLRRARERRQLLISTHDERFAGLMRRKLRPVREGQRTRMVELEGWDRPGPTVRQTELERDEEPVRIA